MKLAALTLFLSLALVTGGCVVSLDSQSAKESFDQTFPLSAGGEVVIDNVNGAVRVATWDRAEVRVEAEKKARGGDSEAARRRLAAAAIDIDNQPDRITVKTRNTKSGSGFFGWIGGHGGATTVNYTITIPARAELSAKTVNGAVTVRDLVGRVVAETVNGSIEVHGVVGTVAAETINGGIDVAMTAFTGDRSLDLSTVNGGISLSLPAETQASLDASVTNGGIDCDLPLSRQEKSRRHLRGELGGGGPAIKLETTNGGIDILAR
ncbi:MAG: DUF4097 family beta strand repeat-containing protein [Thermoanaerobaculia bacterium]|nr:DUF4097 family beta strand repeat-containing protein [Thermoanaerobaculia bacterium]